MNDQTTNGAEAASFARQSLLESLPDAACIIDGGGRITGANSRFQRLSISAATADELVRKVGRHAPARSDPADLSFKKVFSSLVRVDVGGEPQSFQSTIRPIPDDNSKPQEAIVLFREVADHSLVEQVCAELVATLSHEIKTPVTSIRMALELLMEQKIGHVNNAQLELLRVAEGEVTRILRTLRNLLDITEFGDRRYTLHLTWEEPQEIAARAIADSDALAARRQQSVLVESEESLPRIRIDRERIVHALSNMIHGALSASRDGEAVRLRIERCGVDHVRFRVRSPAFSGFETSTDRRLGRSSGHNGDEPSSEGLSLSIARDFVEAHQGHLSLSNDGGRGHDYFISLPIDTRRSAPKAG